MLTQEYYFCSIESALFFGGGEDGASGQQSDGTTAHQRGALARELPLSPRSLRDALASSCPALALALHAGTPRPSVRYFPDTQRAIVGASDHRAAARVPSPTRVTTIYSAVACGLIGTFALLRQIPSPLNRLSPFFHTRLRSTPTSTIQTICIIRMLRLCTRFTFPR